MALGGTDLRHWGVWLIDGRRFRSVLTPRLAGAFPLARATPHGPQPVAWTPVEAWTILRIAEERPLFQGGATARRIASDLPARPSRPAEPDIPRAPAMPPLPGGPPGWPRDPFPPVPPMPIGPLGGGAPSGAPGLSAIDRATLDASKAIAAAMEGARHESAQAFLRTLQRR